MGVPVITPSTTTREQAITDLFESVALQQTALSHILNAEGEKLQRIFAFDIITPETVLAANHSVESTVNAIAGLESVLEMKLRLFTDCDLAYGTDVIRRLYDMFLASDYDVIIGSRNIGKDGYEGYTPLRRLASKTYIRVLCAVGGFRLSDSQCGFKAFSAKAAEAVFSVCETDGFAFDFEAIMTAVTLGYTIGEIPVKIVNHRASKVHVFSDSLKMLRDLADIRRRVRARHRAK